MNKRNIERSGKTAGTALAEKQATHRRRAQDRKATSSEGKTPQQHEDFIPEFGSKEEFDAWWDALPKVKAEVDPRLLEKVKTSIRFSRKTIDGYNYLAEQMGLRSGQTLMKIVLNNYLAQSLPPDF